VILTIDIRFCSERKNVAADEVIRVHDQAAAGILPEARVACYPRDGTVATGMKHEEKQATKENESPHATISPDKQAAEYLANERTFLAWVRTSIAVISMGFVVTKFSIWLHELAVHLNPGAAPRRIGASLPIGVTLMALGGILVALAARRYWVVNRSIVSGRVTADRGLVILVTVLVVFLAVAMILYMLLTSEQA
jgi:putative membrane protein